MAPRQLLLELEEVDMAADKGPKRVRVDRADEGSTQVQLPSRATTRFTSWPLPCPLLAQPDHWPELRLCGTGSECSKRHLRASQHPLILSQ